LRLLGLLGGRETSEEFLGDHVGILLDQVQGDTLSKGLCGRFQVSEIHLHGFNAFTANTAGQGQQPFNLLDCFELRFDLASGCRTLVTCGFHGRLPGGLPLAPR